MIRAGDRALIKRVKGFKLISEGICWKTNSKYSHVEPILDSRGNSIDFRFPKNRPNNISAYFDGQWRVKIIRPTNCLTDDQAAIWTAKGLSFVGHWYDWESFKGFLLNRPIQNPKNVNCGEGMLAMDQSIGQLKAHSGLFISPESYDNFTVAGAFETIYEKMCPDEDDFVRLVEV